MKDLTLIRERPLPLCVDHLYVGPQKMAVCFQTDGFALVRGVLSTAECSDITRLLAETGCRRSGGTRRLLELEWCRSLAARLRERLTLLSGSNWVAVQCTYFEKSRAKNWLVPIHQDLAIPVRVQRDAPSFTAWSRKEGGIFVQPPHQVLEELVAVRIHLDACTESDGPLQVVPGSHQLGVLAAEDALAARNARDLVTCAAEAGDALVMRPLLLHASSKASGSSMRRVLHFLFGPPKLPHRIEWCHSV